MKRIAILIMLILLLPALVRGAEITSAQAGASSSGDTWVGGTPPGDGDTAILAHNVNFDINTTIGTSPAAGNYVVTVNDGITMTIDPNITFVLRGCMLLDNATFIANEGFTFKFDSSQADPNEDLPHYCCSIGNSSADRSLVILNGSAENRGTVTSDASGESGTFKGLYDYTGQGVIQAEYCDFSNLDDGTAYGETLAKPRPASGQHAYFKHCSFDDCGGVDFYDIAADANAIVDHCTFTNSVNTYNALRMRPTQVTTGHRSITNNVIDQDTTLGIDVTGMVIQNNLFGARVYSDGCIGTVETFKYNFFFYENTSDSSEQLNAAFLGTVQYCYFITVNERGTGIKIYTQGDGTINITYNIFEDTGTGSAVAFCSTGDIDAAAAVVNFTHNIVLPSGDNTGSGNMFSISYPSVGHLFTVDNNTFFMGDTIFHQGLIVQKSVADAVAATGILSSFKNNLGWDTVAERGYLMHNFVSHDFSTGQFDDGTAESGGLTTLTDTDKNWTVNIWTSDHRITITGGTGSGQSRAIASNTSDTITVDPNWTTNPGADSEYEIGCVDIFDANSIVDYNNGYQRAEGTIYDENGLNGQNGNGYHAFWTTLGVPGTHDLNVDPQFVDANRKISSWDASLGGAGTYANALAELKKINDADYDSNYTVQALVTYIRAGFEPQNSALDGTGYGGVDIGAVDFSTGWTGTIYVGGKAITNPSQIGGIDVSNIGSIRVGGAEL